jgi:putative transposase
MGKKSKASLTKWANFRFSVIGGLLARPPKKGQLGQEIKKLAQKHYRHPIKGTKVKFGASTIERWYYKAQSTDDPVRALYRKARSDMGTKKAINSRVLSILDSQYKQYPSWSYQLHADNLKAVLAEKQLGQAPSYSTVLRCMQAQGWDKKRRAKTSGQKRAAERLLSSEVRSYEAEFVHALWHLDFHQSSRVVDVNGQWHSAQALCILDDRSRLCCHIQWYLSETAEVLFHGLCQAFHKRGLPRSLMTDNGAAMTAHETTNGLERLGICHDTTLPYSPYQNGKQEAFWGHLEGRLIAMLSRVEPLTLEFLNRATLAWVEQEYNRRLHNEIGTTPLNRLLQGPDVSRQAPDSDKLCVAFTVRETRSQRKSDGTIQIKGIRFEIPSRFRHFKKLYIRYQSWDLSRAWLVDARTDNMLSCIYPQDKIKNADGHRRAMESVGQMATNPVTDLDPIPPLLRKILSDFAATGLPPAYIPKKEQH